MADWGDESDSAELLATTEAVKLYQIDPKNELLWFWFAPPEGTIDPFDGNDEKRNTEMKNRFWKKEEPWEGKPGIIVSTIVVTNYFLELKKEVERLSVNKEREV